MEQTHYIIDNQDTGRVDSYALGAGVMLSFCRAYGDIRANWQPDPASGRLLTVDLCRRGRSAAPLGHGRYGIVAQGEVSVGTVRPDGELYCPGGLYEGVQLVIERERAVDPDGFLALLGLDLDDAERPLCRGTEMYCRPMTPTLENLLEELWVRTDFTAADPGALRYAAVRMLHELPSLPRSRHAEVSYSRSQLEAVRGAEALILQDLSVRHSARELAGLYGMSESGFKLCCRGVLGEGYLPYFRNKRLAKAAELLELTNLKVQEIADLVGYENQGKFAGVFAEKYRAAPLEYRRMSR